VTVLIGKQPRLLVAFWETFWEVLVHAVEKSPPFCPVNGEQEYRVASLRIGHKYPTRFSTTTPRYPDAFPAT
jgi:hypothetical protein